MIRIEYKTIDERNQLIAEHNENGLILSSDEIITDGNFLTFGTITEIQSIPSSPPTIENRINLLEEATNILLGL